MLEAANPLQSPERQRRVEHQQQVEHQPITSAQRSKGQPPHAIIFDLDDTLYPERAYAFSGFDAVAAAFAQRLKPDFDLPARMRQLFDTPDRPRVFNVIAQQCGTSDTIVAEMIERFRHHTPNITLHADAQTALARLRPSFRLGVITDGYAVVQHAKLDALGVQPRVDEVIVTDDFGRAFWKPHPRAFEEMAQRLGVEHNRCTYVADNPAKDFVAPNALGWRTVLIDRPDGVHANNPAPDAGAPAQTIRSLDAL